MRGNSTSELLTTSTADKLRPYYEAARKGLLLLQKCENCSEPFYYPRPFCPHCGSRRVQWLDASGRGNIYSYSLLSRVEPAPYVLAYVTLEEGPTVLSRMLTDDPATLNVGEPVIACFEPGHADVPALVFKRLQP